MNLQIQNANHDSVSAALQSLHAGAQGYAFSMDMFKKADLSIVRDAPLGIAKMVKNAKSGIISGNEMFKNDTGADLGFKVDISTLGQVAKEVIEQRVFREDISKFTPIKVGVSPYYDSLTTFKSFNLSSNPEDGIISVNNTNGQFKEVDHGYDKVNTPRAFWAKQITWNFLQNMQASLAGSFDLLQDKLNTLSLNNEQFQQNAAMYGIQSLGYEGLYTNSSVIINTSLITKKISTMTAGEINTFVATVMGVYQANNAIFEYPDTFIVPQSDFTGLVSFIDPTFPVAGSFRLDYLELAFKRITGNANFKVYGSPYGQKAFSAYGYAALSYDRYILYQNKVDSLYFDMPVPFTLLGAGTQNNASFVQIGYCQIGQVFNKRTQNMLYLDNPNS